jgi:exodeoxyribonuclease VII small subunit
MAKDPDINSRLDQIEEIVEELDVGEVSLDGGQELHEEGQQFLTEIRELIHDGDGEIIERSCEVHCW